MEKENKELTSTYGEDIVNRIKNIISELDIEYYRRLKVSEELCGRQFFQGVWWVGKD